MSTLAVLIDTRKLLSKENGWTQDVYARDAQGQQVDEDHPSATCFCTVGALRRASNSNNSYNNSNYPTYVDARSAVQAVLHNRADKARRQGTKARAINIPSFNDHPDTTHADILELLDDAITLVKAKG